MVMLFIYLHPWHEEHCLHTSFFILASTNLTGNRIFVSFVIFGFSYILFFFIVAPPDNDFILKGKF